jgi:hypothetical protein
MLFVNNLAILMGVYIKYKMDINCGPYIEYPKDASC